MRFVEEGAYVFIAGRRQAELDRAVTQIGSNVTASRPTSPSSMAELTTAVQNRLPIKVVVLDNHSLAQVVFEQKEAGYGAFGTELGAIDFAAFARACGASGLTCRTRSELSGAITSLLHTPGPALLHAFVDPGKPTLMPDDVRG